MFGLTLSESQPAGFLLSKVLEFAFVAFCMARSHGILDEEITRLMLPAGSLNMALAPLAEELGARIASSLEKDKIE